MREIYADFNNFAADGSLDLTCVASLGSIANLEEPLTEDELVWFTDGELRAKGRMFLRPDGSWEGRSDGHWEFLRETGPAC